MKEKERENKKGDGVQMNKINEKDQKKSSG